MRLAEVRKRAVCSQPSACLAGEDAAGAGVVRASSDGGEAGAAGLSDAGTRGGEGLREGGGRVMVHYKIVRFALHPRLEKGC
jgi:hypothetical protein